MDEPRSSIEYANILPDDRGAGFRPSTLVDIPLVRDPGIDFEYSNLTSHLLGIVVARACETDLKSFAQEHLFSPLR